MRLSLKKLTSELLTRWNYRVQCTLYSGKYDDDDDKCGPLVGDIDATLTHAILELCPENTDLYVPLIDCFMISITSLYISGVVFSVCGGKKVVLTDDSEVKNDGYRLSNSSLTEKMADEFEK